MPAGHHAALPSFVTALPWLPRDVFSWFQQGGKRELRISHFTLEESEGTEAFTQLVFSYRVSFSQPSAGRWHLRLCTRAAPSSHREVVSAELACSTQ